MAIVFFFLFFFFFSSYLCCILSGSGRSWISTTFSFFKTFINICLFTNLPAWSLVHLQEPFKEIRSFILFLSGAVFLVIGKFPGPSFLILRPRKFSYLYLILSIENSFVSIFFKFYALLMFNIFSAFFHRTISL